MKLLIEHSQKSQKQAGKLKAIHELGPWFQNETQEQYTLIVLLHKTG